MLRLRRTSLILINLAPLLLALVFLRLGMWQLDRAEARQAAAEAARLRSALPPLTLAEKSPQGAELLYRRAVARGRYEEEQQFLIDGRKQDGKLGYHLIIPFRLEGCDVRVLVNRGWVSSRQPAPPPPGLTEVIGLMTSPAMPALKLAVPESRERPAILPYLDIAKYAAKRDYPVLPLQLVEEPRLARELLEGQLAGQKKWGMHIGYAVQWFAFAVLALGLPFFVNRNRAEV